MASSLWSSIPWASFPADSTDSKLLAWHKHQVPYLADANDLQNLDVWIPTTSTDHSAIPPAQQLLNKNGTWIIYIHGGAWRDPKVDSSSFSATVTSFLSRAGDDLSNVAGFASINYTLSPHPSHPTDPTPPPGSDQPSIPSRNAHHPQHILDVSTAINFLQDLYDFGSNYVLAGHSCGATLSLQVAMDHSRWSTVSSKPPFPSVVQPATILGLNGLYDLPELISNPGEGHAHVIPIYKAFTRGAFGDDETVWKEVSPTCVRDWDAEWQGGKQVVLVQSKEDSLVPYSQTELMRSCLKKYSGGSGSQNKLVIDEMDAGGDHNELWQKGDRLAEILINILGECQ